MPEGMGCVVMWCGDGTLGLLCGKVVVVVGVVVVGGGGTSPINKGCTEPLDMLDFVDWLELLFGMVGDGILIGLMEEDAVADDGCGS